MIGANTFAVILLATVEPKSFTVEVGQTHAEIVRTTEAIQNYNSYAKDAAEVSYYRSVEHLDNREEFKREFIFNFEEIMSEYRNSRSPSKEMKKDKHLSTELTNKPNLDYKSNSKNSFNDYP